MLYRDGTQDGLMTVLYSYCQIPTQEPVFILNRGLQDLCHRGCVGRNQPQAPGGSVTYFLLALATGLCFRRPRTRRENTANSTKHLTYWKIFKAVCDIVIWWIQVLVIHWQISPANVARPALMNAERTHGCYLCCVADTGQLKCSRGLHRNCFSMTGESWPGGGV